MICYAKVLLLVALWAQGCLSSLATENDREAMRETMPLYTVASNLDLLNNTQCQKELQVVRDAIDTNTLWAIRLLDVSGRPGSGFTIGNNLWPGSRSGCDYLNQKVVIPLSLKVLRNASLYRDPKYEYPPFPVQYYIARFVHNSTQQYHLEIKGQEHAVLGLCLPSTCTVDELAVIIEKIFRDRTLLIGRLYSADFKLVKVSDVKDDHQWLLSTQKILAMIWLLVAFALVVVATAYDVTVHQKRLKTKRDFLTFENNNTAELKNDVEAKHEPEPECVSLDAHKPQTMAEKILMCFSAYSNAKQIFTLQTGEDSIHSLHGIKFISMVWIIFVHDVYYSNNYMVNSPIGMMFSDTMLAQIISNATYSVDTFLCVTGFLMCSMYLKVMSREKPTVTLVSSIVQLIQQTIRRFLRLTPTYLIVIFIAILNYTYYDKTSTFQMHEDPSYYCSKYWWRNLLYINNFFAWEELCLSWSWYIANDMQYFFYGSILLMLYNWRSYVAWSVGALTMFTCVFTNGYLAYDLDYVPSVDDVHRTLTVLYMRPWLRIGPFLMGMAAAAWMHKMNYKLKLSGKGKLLGWIIGILSNCLILFGGTQRNMPTYASVMYTAFGRTLWGVGISWVIIACITNNAGVVNKILSYKVWIPLSRLTFCAYLLNPLLITSLNLYNHHETYFDIMQSTNLGLGMIVITYVSSILLSLLAEAPAINVVKILTSRNRRTK